MSATPFQWVEPESVPPRKFSDHFRPGLRSAEIEFGVDERSVTVVVDGYRHRYEADCFETPAAALATILDISKIEWFGSDRLTVSDLGHIMAVCADRYQW